MYMYPKPAKNSLRPAETFLVPVRSCVPWNYFAGLRQISCTGLAVFLKLFVLCYCIHVAVRMSANMYVVVSIANYALISVLQCATIPCDDVNLDACMYVDMCVCVT